MEDHELVLLAALIADGSIIRGTPKYCFGGDGTPLVEKVRAATIEAGSVVQRGT